MTERLAAQYASRVSYTAVRHLTWHILHTAAHCINALYPADIKKTAKLTELNKSSTTVSKQLV